ncbi:MAG TPA: FkbM family methyltransferase [Chthoniobacterales bacterium]|nr:FkbM family methyltransferase [Chthoniobacterales bacterium]
MRSLVSRALGKIVYPFVPARSRLGFRYWLASIDGSLEPELRMLPRLVSKTDVALDIGANAGFYAFRMSKIFSKVYAFEINDDLTGDLRNVNPGKITVMPIGLSSKAGEATLHIPVLNGLPLTGWASLAPGNCPDATGELTKPVKIATLDSFQLKNISFVKIDVEGHELHVLEGARQTLSAHRPRVLIEIKDQNRAAAFEFFSELNYVARKLEDLAGVHGSPENFIFVPAD